MSAESILRRAHRDARRHALLGIAAWALPWLAVAAALAWRLRAGPWPWLAVLALAAGASGYAWRRLASLDARWLARTLDARRRDMEDSAALLLGLQPARGGLQALQRERLRGRIEREAPDLRMRWRRGALAASGGLAAIALATALLWPHAPPRAAAGTSTSPQGAPRRADAPVRLVAQRLQIRPPAYTGLPTRSSDSLSARVPAGATLGWTLRFDPQPRQVTLAFHDGERLPMRREADGRWTATRRIARGTLYRIEPGTAATRDAPPRLYRIDAIADRAPRVRVLTPARTLDLVKPGQERWPVMFEADDDYGLAGAQLRITRTVGSGENIGSQERRIALSGRGDATKRRYAHDFSLAELGMVPGDDLIVQLVVSDRRTPAPQTVRGPSVILRWPPDTGAQASGLDAMMKKVMPAYFRSQRQIIIDAEALLKEKPRLAADGYAQRSDAIGVDQRLLRLRYGQFLGEESEGAPELPTSDAPARDGTPPPTSDAPPTNDPLPTSDAPTDDAQAGHDHEAHAPGDGHDHPGEAPMKREAAFGEERQVLERFGHTHDIPEAATLLDANTRELLRSALNEMWQSEVHLRQAHPETALPYAYRALELIKRVQQSERVYLAKVGVQLPPIDHGRRLTGKREGLADRDDPMRVAPKPDPTLAEAWRALAPLPRAPAPLDLDALARWLASHDAAGGDPLAIAAAIEPLRRDPACAGCRQRLRTLLWPLLATPPAAPAPRKAADAAGNAYLDALGRKEPAR